MNEPSAQLHGVPRSGLVGGALGMFVSLGIIAWAATILDFEAIGRAFASVEAFPWIPLAVGAYLTGHLVRGFRCQRLIRLDADLAVSTTTNIVVIGYAVNNVLPARLGELARVGVLSERAGFPVSQSAAVTFSERLIDGLVILAYFAITAVALHLEGWLDDALLPALLIFGTSCLGFGLAVVFPRRIVGLVTRVGGAIGFGDRLVGFTLGALRGVAYFRSPSNALEIVVLSLVVWALESAMFWFLFGAFGLPLSFGWALFVMAVTNLGILLPSSPGFMGTFHFFAFQALTALGVAGATATGFAIVAHATFYVPVTIWGVAAIAAYGVRLGETLVLARAARAATQPTAIAGLQIIGSLPAPRPAATPARWLGATITALLPPDATPAHAEAVTGFAAAQLRALPALLKIAFAVGMMGFRSWAFVLGPGPLHSMAPARRRRIVTSWAFGPVSLARQLFRPLRSIVLLAHHELVDDELTDAASDDEEAA